MASASLSRGLRESHSADGFIYLKNNTAKPVPLVPLHVTSATLETLNGCETHTWIARVC
jgi:hypothetical protein